MSDEGKLIRTGRLRSTSAEDAYRTVAERLAAQKSAQPFPSNAPQQQNPRGAARKPKILPGTVKTVERGAKRQRKDVVVVAGPGKNDDGKLKAMDSTLDSDSNGPPIPEEDAFELAPDPKDASSARVLELEALVKLKDQEIAKMKTAPVEITMASDDTELAAQLTSTQTRVRELEQELSDVQEQSGDLNAIYKGNDKVLLGKYQEAMKKIRGLQAELTSAKDDAKARLGKAVADAERDARAAKLASEKEKRLLEEKLESNLKEMQAKLNAATNEAAETAQKLEETEANLTAAQELTAKQSTDLAAEQQRTNDAELGQATVQTALAELKTQHTLVDKDRREFELKYENGKMKIVELESSRAKREEENSLLASELASAKSELKTLQESSKKDKKAADQAKAAADKEIERVKGLVAAEDKKAKDLRKKLTEASSGTTDAKNQLLAANKEIENGKKALQKREGELQVEIKAAQDQAEKARHELKEAKEEAGKQVKELAGELHTADTDGKKAVKALEDAQEKLTEAQAKISELDRQISELENDKKQLDKKIDAANAAAAKAAAAKTTAERDAETARADAKRAAESVDKNIQDARADEQRKRDGALALSKGIADAEIVAAKKRVDALVAEAKQRNEELVKAKVEIRQLQLAQKQPDQNPPPQAPPKFDVGAMKALGYDFFHTDLPKNGDEDDAYFDKFSKLAGQAMVLDEKDLKFFVTGYVQFRDGLYTSVEQANGRINDLGSRLTNIGDQQRTERKTYDDNLRSAQKTFNDQLEASNADSKATKQEYEELKRKLDHALRDAESSQLTSNLTVEQKKAEVERRGLRISELENALAEAQRRLQEANAHAVMMDVKQQPQGNLPNPHSDPWLPLRRAADAIEQGDRLLAMDIRAMCADRPWGAAIAKSLGANYSMMFPLAEQVMLLIQENKGNYPEHRALLNGFVHAYRQFGVLGTSKEEKPRSTLTLQIWNTVIYDHDQVASTIGKNDDEKLGIGMDEQWNDEDWNKLKDILKTDAVRFFSYLSINPVLNRHWRYNLSSPFEVLHPLMPALVKKHTMLLRKV